MEIKARSSAPGIISSAGRANTFRFPVDKSGEFFYHQYQIEKKRRKGIVEMGAHFREAAMVEAAVQNILNRPLELCPNKAA